LLTNRPLDKFEDSSEAPIFSVEEAKDIFKGEGVIAII
jgi:hypothetical protein